MSKLLSVPQREEIGRDLEKILRTRLGLSKGMIQKLTITAQVKEPTLVSIELYL
jgi:hypothetical protein